MPAPLSPDLRRRVVRAVEQGSSIRQAARRFEVSPSAAINLLRRLRTTGRIEPERVGGHRRPALAAHVDLIRALVEAQPRITLAELQTRLSQRGAPRVSPSTLWTTLRRLGLSHKKTR